MRCNTSYLSSRATLEKNYLFHTRASLPHEIEDMKATTAHLSDQGSMELQGPNQHHEGGYMGNFIFKYFCVLATSTSYCLEYSSLRQQGKGSELLEKHQQQWCVSIFQDLFQSVFLSSDMSEFH